MLRWLCITLLALGLLFFASYVNHRLRLKAEAPDRRPLGQLITIHGLQHSLYTTGEGEHTLVFLSGGGTPTPILDFKSLYELLQDDYRIVVVERPGYGFSEITNEPRDIDTILEETRTVLKEAGLTPPFILCAHSMSGIHALYWAQRYPDEVSGIVGLDMAVPEAYASLKISKLGLRLTQVAARTGLTRWVPGLADGPAVRHGTLTDHEKDIARALFYEKTMNRTMINEMLAIKDGAKNVASGKIPEVPLLMFVSNGDDTGFPEETWRTLQQQFAKTAPHADIVYLDVGHYVHDFAYTEIAEKVLAWD